MITYIVFILSTIFVVGFVGFWNLCQFMGDLGCGEWGCGIVINFDGSFLDLMVFLIYLGGMAVVFSYTTTMATEQYPEVWVSNNTILGSLLIALAIEFVLILDVLKDEEVEIVFMFNRIRIELLWQWWVWVF